MAQTFGTKPVLASAWQADTLDTGSIHDELNRLWNELGGPRHGGDAPGEMVADPHYGGGGLMRANTLNLIAVATDMREVNLIQQTISTLHDFLPSRAIIIITYDGYDHEAGVFGPRYDVRVELKEQVTDGEDNDNLRFEVITIGADRREIGHLASLVTPLLTADLPDFLWWPSGDFAKHPLFDDLTPVVDRLIVDTAHLGHEIRAIAAIRGIIAEESDAPIVGDFTWLRLEPWRQLIAQFFDPEDVQVCLKTIDQVTIRYAETRDDGSSGLAAALLMTGWLGSRLGWEVIDPLERQKRGGLFAPLRASESALTRDIELRLIPDTSPHARFSLRSVELVSTGKASGTFAVERTDSDDIVTHSETPNNPPVSRMVYSQRPTSQDMIGQEMQRFGADPYYEEAMRFAVRLIPN
ncbi:MAG TPA: glucose-6-phosphate dehydrogenase assembly protein OpcA [Thermomicrobiales bacterium]|nr:glucose-6-phosphate dehydrogenase assembly protein OpcA [Thermomicrobiales bacterium]